VQLTPRISNRLAAIMLLAGLCAAHVRGAEIAEIWEGQPYRIGAALAIDAPGDLAGQLAAELPAYLGERANAAIGAVWRLKTELATGAAGHQMLSGLETFSDREVPAAAPDEDKQLLLTVRATPWGYELSAREYDRYIERWGPTIRRSTRQREAVAEQLFELAQRAVAPLAHLRSTDPKNPREVAIELRGADLPTTGADFAWLHTGDVLQPVNRLTTRDGSLASSGATPMAWTFVEVNQPADGATQPTGTVRGFAQRFSGTRRGRLEQVAIGLRNDPGDTVLTLRSRTEKQKPLVGYDVFAQNIDEKPMRPLGESDDNGDATITPGKTAIQTVYVKSGDLTLAAIPLVPGAEPQVDVWLPDDDMRLRAAARLASLKEDIVDLVARRTILAARVRQQLEQEHLDAASKLLQSLDELPGSTEFGRELDRQSQRLRTKDVQVQRRIDRLFAETRTALGKYLDPRQIGALHEEFRQAEAPKDDAGSGEKVPAGTEPANAG
jgi:hypothetical protein